MSDDNSYDEEPEVLANLKQLARELIEDEQRGGNSGKYGCGANYCSECPFENPNKENANYVCLFGLIHEEVVKYLQRERT